MRRIVFAALPLIASGCAAPPSRQASFAEVRRVIAQREGRDVQWAGVSQGDRALETAVHAMLVKELASDQAEQLALLNNRSLQATFEDLGIAHADLVQAGLLKNPVFDLSLRIPDRRPGRTYLDLSVAESFLDILWLPARKRIAAAQFEATKARVTHEVITLATNTRAAFYEYQASQQTLELRHTVLDAMAASAEAAKALHDAGNINDLELLTQKAQEARAKADLANAEADVVAAKEKLTALMGLWGPDANWKAAGRLPDLPAAEIDPNGLESLAVGQRADLAALKADVSAQAKSAGLAEQSRFFADANLGAEGERETDGQWRIGPTLSVPVPLFDQGQATVAKARAILRQSQQHYAALAVEIRSQVRAARARMFAARAKAICYRDELLPLQNQLVEQMQRQFNGMYVGVFQLLQAKRDQIDAGREYIDALKEYWLARCDLERAVGGRLPK